MFSHACPNKRQQFRLAPDQRCHVLRDMPKSKSHPGLRLPAELATLITSASLEMSKQVSKAFRIEGPRRTRKDGHTLRPGRETPLWNELRAELQPHLQAYGSQVNLGRLLGLPRQRINGFITGGGEMPDAERTLQLLAWLMAVRRGRRPS